MVFVDCSNTERPDKRIGKGIGYIFFLVIPLQARLESIFDRAEDLEQIDEGAGQLNRQGIYRFLRFFVDEFMHGVYRLFEQRHDKSSHIT